MFTLPYTLVRRASGFLALLSLFALGLSCPAHAQNILIWDDSEHAPGSINKKAVTTIGITPTIATNGPDFVTKLNGERWNLVILDIHSNGADFYNSSHPQAALTAYVTNGGAAMTSDWTQNNTLAAAFDAHFENASVDKTGVSGVPGSLLFNGVNVPLNIVSNNWGDYSNGMTTLAGGMIAAKFNDGYGAIVVGNGGRTILNGFLSDTYKSAGQADRLQLAENEIKFLLTGQGFSIGTLDGAANAHALVTGFVTLRTPAPAGGETLPLSSDNAVATVPASVFVPEGASYATFPVQINSIASVNKANVPVTVTFGTTDGAEDSESSFTAYPAGIARADSYVQDGAGADTNFGTAPTLLVSSDGSGGSGNNRDAYLRFKFDGFRNVSKARLRVYASVSDSIPTPVGVYGVATNGWDQTTLTFNNRPALTGLLKSFTASGASVVKYDIDVTPYVQAALASGKTTVSLALHLPNAATGTVSIVSKETIDLKPQLILQGN